ncbi:MAG: FxLYD domain-containing protein [Nitrososphaeraceae archaeon]
MGNLHLVGEIENGTPDPVTFVQASATFYDKNNRVVGTGFGYTNPPDLGPGDKAPFEIIVTSLSIPAKQIKNYRVTVSYD